MSYLHDTQKAAHIKCLDEFHGLCIEMNEMRNFMQIYTATKITSNMELPDMGNEATESTLKFNFYCCHFAGYHKSQNCAI